MCQQSRKDFYKKFLTEGLPIESHLPANLIHRPLRANKLIAIDAVPRFLRGNAIANEPFEFGIVRRAGFQTASAFNTPPQDRPRIPLHGRE